MKINVSCFASVLISELFSFTPNSCWGSCWITHLSSLADSWGGGGGEIYNCVSVMFHAILAIFYGWREGEGEREEKEYGDFGQVFVV